MHWHRCRPCGFELKVQLTAALKAAAMAKQVKTGWRRSARFGKIRRGGGRAKATSTSSRPSRHLTILSDRGRSQNARDSHFAVSTYVSHTRFLGGGGPKPHRVLSFDLR